MSSFFGGFFGGSSNNSQQNNQQPPPVPPPTSQPNPTGESNARITNNILESQARVLMEQGQSAYLQGELDQALSFMMEAVQLFIEVYKAEPEGSGKKAQLYSVMENGIVEAEKVKGEIRERNAVIEAARNAPQQSPRPMPPPPSSSTSSNDSKKKGTKGPAKPLPDTFDYSAPRKPPVPTANIKKPIGKPTTTTTTTTATTPRKQSKAEPSQLKAEAAKPNEYAAQIMEEILDKSPGIHWDDIAGLAFAKQTLQEAVILPNLRPDLFTGLRAPPKGVLLFGPPGTGKTMLAKAVATESGFVFFSISASSVTSKWLGEGEKLIKALFELARQKQPAVIFIDEIDSLMSARKENEHEASRRVKTEFMTQMDGAASSSEDRILVMGATNLPWDIDEAVLRRMPKRIYVPLPDADTRRALITHLLKKQGPSAGHFSARDLDRVVALTEGYSGSDLTAVCHEAALGPIREIGTAALRTIRAEEVRPMNTQDFVEALRVIRPSVSGDNLKTFAKWSEQFGVTR